MKSVAMIATLMALALPVASAAQSVAPPVDQTSQAPGFYRINLGRLTVTVLTDGAVSVPYDKLLKGKSPEDIAHAFAATGESPQRPTSINIFLIDTGDRRILIDAGAGNSFGACCGRLPETLAAAGYRTDQIDAVVLTHVHGDHSGGLTRNGERTFPKAELYLAKAELDYGVVIDQRSLVTNVGGFHGRFSRGLVVVR